MYKDIRKELPLLILAELDNSGVADRELFAQSFKKKRKYISHAYLCWSLMGAHHIYLNQSWLKFLIACFFIVGILWYLLDFFRIPFLVKEYNETVAKQILIELRSIRGHTYTPQPPAPSQTNGSYALSQNLRDESVMKEIRRQEIIRKIGWTVGTLAVLYFIFSNMF